MSGKRSLVFVLFFILRCSGEPDDVSFVVHQEEVTNSGYRADIFIDRNGLPYVEAERTEDGFFAIGYITAKMRYAQIDIIRVASNALISSLLDVEEAIKVDSLTIRTLINIQTGELVTERQWKLVRENAPDRARILQAFVDGMNFYIKRLEEGKEELPPEYESPILSSRNPQKNKGKFYISPSELLAVARFEEWYLTGESDLAFSRIKSRIMEKITGNMEEEKKFAEILTARAGADFFTLPSPRINALTMIPFRDFRWGSNNFVISATLASKPIVANDPHVPFLNPPLWFPIRAKVGNLYFEGFALASIPGILSGTNGSVAWAVTNAGYDSLDLYVEKIKADQRCPSGFSFIHNVQDHTDDSCVRVVEHRIGSRSLQKIKVYYCDTHGVILGKKHEVLNGDIPPEPKLEDGGEYISFIWNGHFASREVFAFLKILEAKTVDEFMESIKEFEVAPVNFVFADLEGNIGYGTFALLPDRKWDLRRHPPTDVLPSDGCCDWKSWIPKEKFPHTKNPQKGFIVTANNDLPGYTADGDPFDDPVYLFWSYDPGYRIAEITHMIREKAKDGGISEMDAIHIMEDTISFWTRETLRPVLDILKGGLGQYNEIEKKALEILERWDMTCKSGFKLEDLLDLAFYEIQDEKERSNSSACTVWWVFVSKLLVRVFSDEFATVGEKLDPFLEDYLMKNIFFHFSGRADRSILFDDLSTPERESVQDVVIRSFREAVGYLSSSFGDEPGDWLWGKLARAKLYHPISQAGLSVFDIGPMPVDLGPLAPSVAWLFLVTDEPKKGFTITGGPSFRSIAVPEGDVFRLRFALPGGVAGFGIRDDKKTVVRPDPSNNFCDLLPTFFGGGYVEFARRKENYKKKISLVP